MTIAPGVRLGPYEVVASLGAGGMGEVYKARDTRLDRSVAIKVLPSHMSSNPALRERFDREAKAISSLSHPNICALYDVGEAPLSHVAGEETADEEPIHYLIMEYLEGESLADRLAKGPLPLEQVLRYGVEIASALDMAHRSGIVHRDLKPGNVMLTKSGAKLLDFGLAKYAQSQPPIELLTSVPTEHKPLTQEGTILGTFQYMAPEQLAGEESDARTDIFALGAVLYEMLTGVRAFQGKNKASLIGAIVSGEPRPVSALQPLTPPALEHVIRKCLAKEPDDRWQSAHDIAGELKWIGEAGSQAGVAIPLALRRRSRERLAWSLCAVAAIVALFFAIGYMGRSPKPQKPVHLTVMPPLGTSITSSADLLGMALSPDGSQLAFSAVGEDGKRALWIRSFSEDTARHVAATEGASYPFWSPDGRHVGFFADGKLKKVDLAGGTPQIVTDAASGRGGAWGSDGTILFVPHTDSGIYRVPASGGSAVPVIPDSDTADCRWPHFLPDGEHFLYVTTAGELHVASLDGSSSMVTANASNAVYVDPGYIVYGRGNDLMVQPFDSKRLEAIGEPFAIIPGRVRSYEPKILSFFTAAGSSLVYAPTREIPDQMAWYGRHGQHLENFGPLGSISSAAISADDRRLAFILSSSRTGKGDLWIRDLVQNRDMRLTYVDGLLDRLAWSPDGSRIALTYLARDVTDIYLIELSGGEMQPIVESAAFKRNVSWLPRGEGLVFAEQNALTDFDVWMWSFENQARKLLFSTPFYEGQTAVSPDGRWLAYASTESGKREIYMRSLDGSATQLQISTGGGSLPFWRKDGKELFYAGGDRSVMAVTVTGGSAFEVGAPVRLFQLPEGASVMDATSDGEKFLLSVWTEEPPAAVFEAILNWESLVTKRLAEHDR